MINYILKLKYPQSIWAREIYDLIIKNNIKDDFKYIYDVPCGAGFISNNLRSKVDQKIFLIDIDNKKISFAKKHFKYDNFYIENNNMYKISYKENSLWLFINSLYMLNDIDKFMYERKKSIKYIIGVFPNINSENYKFFTKNIDPDLNCNEMTEDETIKFFSKQGYKLIDKRTCTYFNYLKYSNKRYSKMLAFMFSILEKVFFIKGNNYWIGLFKIEN